MPNPRPLTRKELSQFLPDERSIKAFEELFNLIPSEIIEIDIESGSSDAKAVQSEAIGSEALRLIKGANVLLWLSM
tara:strand:- start:850 stop:1077 length:228 start_codon:yes stop_codon:yes gene_type:complete